MGHHLTERACEELSSFFKQKRNSREEAYRLGPQARSDSRLKGLLLHSWGHKALNAFYSMSSVCSPRFKIAIKQVAALEGQYYRVRTMLSERSAQGEAEMWAQK